jgi:hypothetical protein
MTSQKGEIKKENCTHEVYNRDCDYCTDVVMTCSYAAKEGYADFDPEIDWDLMKDYHNKCEAFDPMDYQYES